MEGPAGMTVQPRPDLGVLVGGVVVDDGVDHFAGRDGALDGVEETDEFLMAMALHVAADGRAVEHVERGKERGRPVALVVVGHRAAPPRLHGKTGLGAIERLDLAFAASRPLRPLIGAEDHRMGRRIDVEPDDVLHLFGELRIVGQLEQSKAMRSKLMETPGTLDRTDGNADGRGHGAGGPVRRLMGRFGVRQSHHPIDNRLVERHDARWPRLVLDQAVDPRSHETFLPAPDAGLRLAGLAPNGIGPETRGREKHDPRTPDVFLRAVPIQHDRIQSLAVRIGQRNRHPRAHAPDSHKPDRGGIPRGTRALGLNH